MIRGIDIDRMVVIAQARATKILRDFYEQFYAADTGEVETMDNYLAMAMQGKEVTNGEAQNQINEGLQ